ncbi:MAG TPA: YraN family protein [Stenotrophobium sp.]|jgi:putative endonuclease|nr:YraN family protein [Stenotrophobium sp.]
MKGAAAEDLALRHLQAQGLKLLARNWRCAGGELDLVMRDRDTLVIAEVRKRSSTAFGGAAASVDARKQARIVHATRLFLAAHRDHAQDAVRFDVVALDAGDNIQWLRAAFDAQD